VDEAYIQKLARYVDGKNRAVSEATEPGTDACAVLTAMAIADEAAHRARTIQDDKLCASAPNSA